MADKSKIEWTESTWNPIVGCSVISPGCTHCYAMRMAARLQKMNRTGGSGSAYVNAYDGTTIDTKAGAVWSGKVALAPEHILTAPLRRWKPTTYFVNAMGDLFHESVPDEWIDKVFVVMALAPQHTFQVLTKRGDRMRAYVSAVAAGRQRYTTWAARGGDIARMFDLERKVPPLWPLPNVWLGVSAEDQQRADERIPDLLATPAVVRFVSAEPLLGPIDFMSTLGGTLWMGGQRGSKATHRHPGRAGDVLHGILHECDPTRPHHHHDERCGQGLDWIIVGGESGHDARPMHPAWARSIRDQCAATGVPFFFKQHGEWSPVPSEGQEHELCVVMPDGQVLRKGKMLDRANEVGEIMFRLGKKQAGRLLDGCEHNAMPEVL